MKFIAVFICFIFVLNYSAEESTTEDSTAEDSTTEDSTTEESTVEDSTTEESTVEDSATEESTVEDAATEEAEEDSTELTALLAASEVSSAGSTEPIV